MTGTTTILAETRARIADAPDVEALRAIEREVVGKDGVVASLLKSIPGLPPEERKGAGQSANELKQAVLAAIEEREASLGSAALEAERRADGFDGTLPPPRVERGTLHPVTQVTRELEDLFTSMGYMVLDGPEVELDDYNFEKLNIPGDHPARDSQDTFYCSSPGTSAKLLLRTHTSPVQVRAMERLEPPFRAIVPGKVFRQGAYISPLGTADPEYQVGSGPGNRFQAVNGNGAGLTFNFFALAGQFVQGLTLVFQG